MDYYKPMQHLLLKSGNLLSTFYVILQLREKLKLMEIDTSDNAHTIYKYWVRVDSTDHPFYSFEDEHLIKISAAHKVTIEVWDSSGTTKLGEVTNNSADADTI